MANITMFYFLSVLILLFAALYIYIIYQNKSDIIFAYTGTVHIFGAIMFFVFVSGIILSGSVISGAIIFSIYLGFYLYILKVEPETIFKEIRLNNKKINNSTKYVLFKFM